MARNITTFVSSPRVNHSITTVQGRKFIHILRYACRVGSLTTIMISDPEQLNELQKVAVRFEEKIYTQATNQVI